MGKRCSSHELILTSVSAIRACVPDCQQPYYLTLDEVEVLDVLLNCQ